MIVHGLRYQIRHRTLWASGPSRSGALILDTAASRFEAKGYAETFVDEIVRELGITKAAVYHYWGSKEELLAGIQDRALALSREMLDRLDEEYRSAELRLYGEGMRSRGDR